MTDRIDTTGRKKSRTPVQRSLPRRRPGDGRSMGEQALAAQMLLKLRRGEDVRADRVADARLGVILDHVDTRWKLDVALDRMIDEAEAEGEGNA